MRIKKLLPLLMALAVLAGCRTNEKPSSALSAPPVSPSPTATPLPTPAGEDPEIIAERERAERVSRAVSIFRSHVDEEFPAEEFLLWLESLIYPPIMAELSEMSDDIDIGSFLLERTGESLHVLKLHFYGLMDNPEAAAALGIYFAPENGSDVKLAFGGDVNLIEGSYVMPYFRLAQSDLANVLTDGLLEEMRAADVLLLNNEFAYSNRGYPIPGKTYTFRAPPENVGIFADMGVDVAYLANNHIFDYGADALLDTLQTLDEAGIPRIGAGMDINEASRPVFYIAGGRKIAYIGAGCIERYSVFTPGAGEETPGIFRVDENNAALLLSIIENCAKESDLVVVNLHWGIESTSVLEEYQRQLGQMCIDAGADAVIGAHPHVLQGAEFYNGKPIIYSTGNFWFSTTQNYTCLIELLLDTENNMSVKFLPCTTGGGITRLAHGDTAAQVIEYYRGISFGVNIDEDGYITDARS